MKEATGELNMTVVAVVAIAAIAGIFALLLPTIKNKLTNTVTNVDSSVTCPDGKTYQDGVCK